MACYWLRQVSAQQWRSHILVKHLSCKGRGKLSLLSYTLLGYDFFLNQVSNILLIKEKIYIVKVFSWTAVKVFLFCFVFVYVHLCVSKMKSSCFVRNLKWTSFVQSCGPNPGGWFLFRSRALVWFSVVLPMYGPQTQSRCSFSSILAPVLCSFACQVGVMGPRGIVPKITLLETAELILQLILSDPKSQEWQLPRLSPTHLYL